MTGTTPPDGTDRRLPRWLKAVLLTVVIAVSIVVLFTWVFPWVEELTQVPTIGAQLLRLPR
jgi:hypothetical protein